MWERGVADGGQELRLYTMAAVLGLAVGAVGTAFHLLVDALVGWQTALAGTGFGWMPGWPLAALVSGLMVAASILLVRRFAPETAGSGVQEIEGALDDVRPLRWQRVLPVKFVAGTLALGSGLVLGREGPTIHIGAALGKAAGLLGALGRDQLRALIAAGAAAGLATAFNAPLSAIFFVIEETRRQVPYTFTTYSVVILTACLATFMTEVVAGVGPDLYVPVPHPPILLHYPVFLALGALLAFLGLLFNRGLVGMLDLIQARSATTSLAIATGFGALAGLLVAWLPAAAHGGEDLIPRLIYNDPAFGLLLLVLAVRVATSICSYGSGVPGGIFAPMLALATLVGLASGKVVDMAVPWLAIDGPSLAIAAMAGLFAAVVRAPMVGATLAVELTGAFELVLPVILTAFTANVVAHVLGSRPIYTILLERTLHRAAAPAAEDGMEEPGYARDSEYVGGR